MSITVVCPFYNEAEILEEALRTLLAQLGSLPHAWELIVVNDGSTDGSAEIAQRVAEGDHRLRVLGYRRNRGRGYALRTGIAAATGDVIVTTEIDLSWGERIVHELVEAMDDWPDADIVVASPHLKGGAYRNVPRRRVWLSRVGNMIIRTCMSRAATMNTGMTRAYRRPLIQSLPLTEDGKEFHLEVILKARAFGARIREIPAVLEWKEYKHRGERVKRKSSSRVNKLILSHTLFSLFATPVRYVWAMSMACLLLGALALAWALILLYLQMVSAYVALLSVSLVVLGIVLFVLGVVLQQGNMIQRELWLMQRRSPSGTRQEGE
ncbi:MAG: glycosyltransferase family 2 protein [Gemmatimonadota bacterium]|nr:glycosyltransferase family 2 protein [Gemmatimonadota bacterium]MDH5198772.1 glycosyltransferase family 2 protein [Gemmatimonadota bacterium]